MGYNLRVFEEAFDLTKDSILVLSSKKEIIHINQSFVSLLQLHKDIFLGTLKNLPEVKIKKRLGIN